MPHKSPSLTTQKDEARRAATARRRQQPQQVAISQKIIDAFYRLPFVADAQVVLMYIHAYSEVQTISALPRFWNAGQKVVVPYCVSGALGLFHLESLDELAKGAFGILEPKPELRDVAAKLVEPAELDLLAIPGLAFDRQGTRLGYGYGHFDRLLPQCRQDAIKIALAFDCQLVQNLPQEPHDIPMDWLVTQTQVIEVTQDTKPR